MMTEQRFYYRVRVKDKVGSVGEFLADTKAELDETARRRIIACELKDGGQVLKITIAEDKKRHTGDWMKRTYPKGD